MMPVRLLAIVTGLLLVVGSVQAQPDHEVSIAAEARPTKVGTAETVVFAIEVQGVPLSAIETPEPPPAANLVLQGATPTTQRELSFDSGQLTRRITFEWTYKPMQVGVGRLRSATVRIRNDSYTTDEIRVRIVPQSQRPQSATRGPTDLVSPPGRADASNRGRLDPRDLFIRATASADTAYQNEQVTAEYRLFFRPGVRLRQSRMADAWDAPGFWREELDVASRPTPRTTTLYGRTYRAIVLKRVALFPTQTGRLEVDPLRIETEARARSQLGHREAPARSPYEPVTLSSEDLMVVARALPPGAPSAFDGAVGTFSLDTQVGTDSLEVGEAVEVTARILGTGNVATLSPPRFTPPADFETYDPSVETEIDRSGSTIRGSKTVTYTLVPRSNGSYTLPPVRFAYFDPDAGQYETLRSGPMAVHVTGDVPPRAASRTGEGLPIGDIAGRMEAGRWQRTDRAPLYAQPWAYVAVLVPVVLAVGGIACRRLWGGSAPPVQTSSALTVAQRHLHDAHRHLRDGRERAFYRTVEQSVLTFLEERLDLPSAPSRMTGEALDRHLERHGASGPDRTALRALLDTCNEAQFGPAEPSYDAKEATLDHAQSLLRRLDDSLPASLNAERA